MINKKIKYSTDWSIRISQTAECNTGESFSNYREITREKVVLGRRKIPIPLADKPVKSFRD